MTDITGIEDLGLAAEGQVIDDAIDDSIDLTEVADLKTIPEGIYLGTVLNFQRKKTQNDTIKYVYEVQIDAPEEQAKDVGKVFMDFPTSKGAQFRLKQIFKACGSPIIKQFNPNAIIGKKFAFICSVEDTAQWGCRNRFNRFLPAMGVVGKTQRTQAEVDKQSEAAAMRGFSDTAASATDELPFQ